MYFFRITHTNCFGTETIYVTDSCLNYAMFEVAKIVGGFCCPLLTDDVRIMRDIKSGENFDIMHPRSGMYINIARI